MEINKVFDEIKDTISEVESNKKVSEHTSGTGAYIDNDNYHVSINIQMRIKRKSDCDCALCKTSLNIKEEKEC